MKSFMYDFKECLQKSKTKLIFGKLIKPSFMKMPKQLDTIIGRQKLYRNNHILTGYSD